MKKRVFAILVTLGMLISMLSTGAYAAGITGQCGDNLTYTLTSDGVLTISGTGEMYASAFIENTEIRRVIIEDGVTSIGSRAFFSCSNIESIDIPDTVTSIGSFAFVACHALRSITIPDSVTCIPYEAFYHCSTLESVNLPDGLTEIEEAAFMNCYELTDLVIPDSVTSIGPGAFVHCGFETFTIPDGVTSIKDGLFSSSKLVSVKIPESVVSIEYTAFYYCDDLTDVYYAGSEADWANIAIEEENECLLNAEIHYNCDIYEPEPEPVWKNPYSDIDSGAWYYDAIEYVTENHLMNGVGDGLFAPDNTTERGMIITVLWRMEGEPLVDSDVIFSDVPYGMWYSEAAAWAAMNGIVQGDGDGTFRPEDPMTSEELAAVLYRYAKFKGYDVSAAEPLGDEYAISDWAVANVEWLNAVGILDELIEHGYAPTDFATRYVMAEHITKFLSNYSV